MPLLAPQMRTKLAKCAFDLFAQKGIKDVNLDEVASAAGVTKGSLYWHYKSKKELILAACTYYYRRWQQRAHAEIAVDTDPLGQLRRVLRYSVQSCLFDKANRVFTTDVFALSLQDPDIRAGWSQFYDSVRELWVGLVRGACLEGQIAVSDPRRAVDWMLAAIEGIKQRAAFEPEICTPDEREAMVDGLLRILTVTSIPGDVAEEVRYLVEAIGRAGWQDGTPVQSVGRRIASPSQPQLIAPPSAHSRPPNAGR